MSEDLKLEIKNVINEYKEFCKDSGMTLHELILYIYENILYDYDLSPSEEIFSFVKSNV